MPAQIEGQIDAHGIGRRAGPSRSPAAGVMPAARIGCRSAARGLDRSAAAHQPQHVEDAGAEDDEVDDDERDQRGADRRRGDRRGRRAVRSRP